MLVFCMIMASCCLFVHAVSGSRKHPSSAVASLFTRHVLPCASVERSGLSDTSACSYPANSRSNSELNQIKQMRSENAFLVGLNRTSNYFLKCCSCHEHFHTCVRACMRTCARSCVQTSLLLEPHADQVCSG